MKRLMTIFIAASFSFLILSVRTEIRAQETNPVPGEENIPKASEPVTGAIVKKKPPKKALKELKKELKKTPKKKTKTPVKDK
jgi:hypothetical protein